MSGTMNVKLETPGPVEQYLRHLEQGRFMLQRSKQSGEIFYYPRAFAAGAPSADLEWVEMSGDGTVYSTTTVRRKPEHGGDYDVSLVQLAEGPRILTRVLGIEPHKVTIGMKVKARIEKPAWDSKATRPLVVFYPI
jgi:uncharacterized OB-fold protein